MSDGYFRLSYPISDVRVSPAMDTCTRCGAPLPDAVTAADGSAMVLFAQCRGCNTVFIQDFADFDPQKGRAAD